MWNNKSKEILSGGSSTFEPGLLARANRGIYTWMKLTF
jgi:Mg-chelatase subunit ChlI